MNICLPHKIRARCITYLSSTPINRKSSKSSLRSTRINDTASIQRNYTQYPHIILLLPQKYFPNHISSHQLTALQAANYLLVEPIVIHLSSRKLSTWAADNSPLEDWCRALKSRQQGHKRRQERISHKAQDRRRETGRARCKIKGTGNELPAEGLGARSRRSPGSIPGKEERNGRKEDIKKAPQSVTTAGALLKKRRLPTLPLLRSTIGVTGLNFSVRNGKRWNPGKYIFKKKLRAISNARLWCHHLYTCILSTSSSLTTLKEI